MGDSIWPVASGWDVSSLQQQLAEHPELWNEHTHRTVGYGNPHSDVSDIWVRYRPFREFAGDVLAYHSGAHVSEWFPCIAQIPAAWSLARKVRRLVGAERIGGVLITKVPPGGQVAPHVDTGWHAESHRKFIVQVQGNQRQAFCFAGEELRANDGDVYGFHNDRSHWVTNDSDTDRISLIVCVR
jgi:hypothetical protein